MKLKIQSYLPLMLSAILLSTRSAAGSSTVSFVASPFQKPGPGGDVVVAAVLSPADGVTSAELAYRYDPAVMTPTGVYRTGYTNGFSLASNLTMQGIVEIHLSGSTPLVGSGEVAWVPFHLANATGTQTPLSWVSAMLNGGGISTQMKSASLSIGSAPVVISAPSNLTGAPGSQVVIPISASSFSGASSLDLSMSFNPAILSPVSVMTTSLTGCMTAASNVTIPGKVNIGLYGLCSIAGSGPVAMVIFNVVGPAGSRTPLNVTRGAINEEHVPTVLQDGLFFSCETADRDGDGFSTCAGDCDDTNGLIHPGAVETCNTTDDDCDGLVDNVALPAGTPLLHVEKLPGDARLSWPASAGAVMYDVVGGSLQHLCANGGDFSISTDLCLANDTASTESHDPSIPVAGQGLWYVVRAENCGGFGSFDAGDGGQVRPRDPGITASASHCP